MVLMASTWDITGGQMGYNSLGNITFFGVGMYVSAVIQVSMFYDIALYTASYGAIKPEFTDEQYFTGLAIGIVAAGVVCVGLARVLGAVVFGLRGPYFAIGTLGVAIAAGQIAGTIDTIGGGAGISMPFFATGHSISVNLLLYHLFCSSDHGAFHHPVDVLNPVWFSGKCNP
jgi:branched-chain amino acid transport system permease protein